LESKAKKGMFYKSDNSGRTNINLLSGCKRNFKLMKS
jgi:hypothetical protein